MEYYKSLTAFSKIQLAQSSTSAQATHLRGATAPMDIGAINKGKKARATDSKARTTRAKESRRASTTTEKEELQRRIRQKKRKATTQRMVSATRNRTSTTRKGLWTTDERRKRQR